MIQFQGNADENLMSTKNASKKQRHMFELHVLEFAEETNPSEFCQAPRRDLLQLEVLQPHGLLFLRGRHKKAARL
ncbi:hypothetical protein GN956_G12285 [Arapaima gigas]